MLDQTTPLLASTTLTTAVTAAVTEPIGLDPQAVKSVGIQSTFDYGSGGTNLKVWLQTSFDAGVTWTDIACQAFTTADARKLSSVYRYAAGAEAVATDGALADDTELSGRIGDRIRLKYTSTGTYGGSTTLRVDGILS